MNSDPISLGGNENVTHWTTRRSRQSLLENRTRVIVARVSQVEGHWVEVDDERVNKGTKVHSTYVGHIVHFP